MPDLISASKSIELRRFRRGRDGGIDARALQDGKTVLQAKHYVGTGFPGLKSRIKNDELKKIKRLDADEYILATSVSLSPDNADELMQIIGTACTGGIEIYGQDDLNTLLRFHPEIERAHFKLWLSSTGVLERILNASAYNRNDMFLETLQNDTRVFVPHRGLADARSYLNRSGVCVLSGPPGVGKSITAKMLLAISASEGFELAIVRDDIEEALSMWKPGEPQIFYYDDFLGTAAIEESLAKNEDRELSEFLRRVESTPEKRLVLTTREYLLQSAYQRFESLARSVAPLRTVTVEMSDYSLVDKGRILYNHLFFADAPREQLDEFVENQDYWKVLRHSNFTPRLIEQATLRVPQLVSSGGSVAATYLEVLDDPESLWSHAFENQLDNNARLIAMVLFFRVRPIELPKLIAHFERVAMLTGSAAPLSDIHSSVRALERTILSFTPRRSNDGPSVEFANPSVRDYLANRLARSDSTVDSYIASCESPEELLVLAEYAAGARGDIPFTAADKALRSVLSARAQAIAMKFGMLCESAPGRFASRRLQTTARLIKGVGIDMDSTILILLEDLKLGDIETFADALALTAEVISDRSTLEPYTELAFEVAEEEDYEPARLSSLSTLIPVFGSGSSTDQRKLSQQLLEYTAGLIDQYQIDFDSETDQRSRHLEEESNELRHASEMCSNLSLKELAEDADSLADSLQFLYEDCRFEANQDDFRHSSASRRDATSEVDSMFGDL